MESWLEFGRGPLFRLCFALMVLGLLRIFLLTLVSVSEAYRRAGDKIVPWRDLALRTIGWLIPVKKLWTKRPIYSLVSFVFHVGLIPVPLLLAAHILLWKNSVGFGWPALPQPIADWLTLLVVLAGPALFLGRLMDRGARQLSRRQDYLWPLLLAVPFITGYLCVNAALSPSAYQVSMLIHIYSGNLIMVLIPFTKIAHCVLTPLSQLVTAVGWKFPAGYGDRVRATLGKADRPSWVLQPEAGGKPPVPAAKE